ncbi:MAG TPA: EamA family transporter [Candidatus Baltobacteraceae bacterium]|nr:EamA family transporter [Candidatus Baltobacteraceae bacterium]
MPGIPDRRTRALVALAALAFIWGYNWVIMRVAVHDAPPFQFAAWRTFGGAIALVITALVLRKSLRPQFPAASFWIGFFQTTCFVGLISWAVVTAGAGQVAMLAYTMPLWVSLLAWPLLDERIGMWQGVAIGTACVGVACMVGPLRSIGPAEVAAVLAGLAWAIGIILTKRLQRGAGVDLFGLTMWQMLFGGFVLVIVALVVPAHPTTWNPAYILAIGYNIVFATALAYSLWIFALDVLPARDAGMGTLANPIVAVLAAWIQLGEIPGRLAALGMLLIVAGLAMLTLADRRASR